MTDEKQTRLHRGNHSKSIRNFGIGSRNLLRAGKICSQQSEKSFSTRGTLADRWTVFAKWLGAEYRIGKMENITPDHLIAYGRHLNSRIEQGELKPSTAQLYVSAVNSVLITATAGNWKTVSPTKDCGIPKRKYLPESSKALPQSQHDQVIAELAEQTEEPLDQRVIVLLNLQRTLGLRFKESALLDARQALLQAGKTGTVSILTGTKGGKRRDVPVSSEAKLALKQAANIQDGRSMIPTDMSYVKFREACYAKAQQLQFNFHAQRHHYAQQRYHELTGAPAPINTGIPRKDWLNYLASFLNVGSATAEAIDHKARLQLSTELGHNRLEVVSVYIG
ncbi:integrase domain-containing protein [Methylomonas paludis]|uniref:Integrase domain-containing protein n=1 Tax=Methylomonas paludis TaxID=1173101 RepID=A0A975R9U9_9GAMM|nr:integrase domain-containing protein [Methylomonas paludis]QWF70566.1 integrase domain-containing protein [Methylomonas paludis]